MSMFGVEPSTGKGIAGDTNTNLLFSKKKCNLKLLVPLIIKNLIFYFQGQIIGTAGKKELYILCPHCGKINRSPQGSLEVEFVPQHQHPRLSGTGLVLLGLSSHSPTKTHLSLHAL